MMTKGDEDAEDHPRGVEVDAEIRRENILAIAQERRSTVADLRGDRRPHDDAEADVADQLRYGSADDGRGDDRDAERHHQDVDGLPQGADLGTPVLADGVEPGPGEAFAQVAHGAQAEPERRPRMGHGGAGSGVEGLQHEDSRALSRPARFPRAYLCGRQGEGLRLKPAPWRGQKAGIDKPLGAYSRCGFRSSFRSTSARRWV